jgi:hypothetical protein
MELCANPFLLFDFYNGRFTFLPVVTYNSKGKVK